MTRLRPSHHQLRLLADLQAGGWLHRAGDKSMLLCRPGRGLEPVNWQTFDWCVRHGWIDGGTLALTASPSYAKASEGRA